MAEFRHIPRDKIAPPPLPIREAMDEQKLEELAGSIRVSGIIQPLIVQETPEGFEIVAGHRRYLASAYAGLDLLPCVVYPQGGIAVEAVKLHENIYREDITAAEEARFYAELIEKYDLTEEALFQMVRQGANYVYARLNLLRGAPEVLEAVAQRKINLSVAQQLNKCTDADHRKMLLLQAIESEAPARVVMQWIADWRRITLPPSPPAPGAEAAPAAHVAAAPSLACFLCGGDRDPYNLEAVYIHKWEREMVRKIIDNAANPGAQ